MKVAIIGPGAIGSTFAFQLSRAGHHVTVVARGARLQQISRDRAIVLATGERSAVTVATELDPVAELIFGSFEGIMAVSLTEKRPAAAFRKRADNFLKMVTNT
jgi:3-hydroxyisobutyrate dehydrogenase-like beta-hydroxyacid dehydrogenase